MTKTTTASKTLTLITTPQKQKPPPPQLQPIKTPTIHVKILPRAAAATTTKTTRSPATTAATKLTATVGQILRYLRDQAPSSSARYNSS